VHARQSQPHPNDKPRQLQRRLYRAAKRSRHRRFHALYDRLIRPDVVWRAWEEVRANGGSAGVDGVGIEDVARGGVQGFLDELAADLQARRYRPKPVLRVDSPQPDGRQRPLGIPTGRDRVVQAACKLVVEPVCEASFRDSS
jgi:RNA-directed DNA polymerase